MEAARGLLERAVQTLESGPAHLAVTTRLAALEFRSPNGDAEWGRTMFEGVLASFPRRLDLWGQLVDLETSVGTTVTAEGGGGKKKTCSKEAAVAVRDVFERATKVRGLKPRAVKKWFRRWVEWEEAHGDAKSKARVMARAAEWVKAAEARKAKAGGDKDGDGNEESEEDE